VGDRDRERDRVIGPEGTCEVSKSAWLFGVGECIVANDEAGDK
jgi:hypothetical protein